MNAKVSQIKNQVYTSDGNYVRRLVIETASNHPRPVWRSDRSNSRSPNAGTYQQVKPGDTVITVTISPGSDSKISLNFCLVNDDGKTEPVDSGFNFYPVINNITTLVREWLYEPTSQPYLPKGVGWDGENPEIEKIKMEKAWSVLPRGVPSEYLDEMNTAISYTPVSVFDNLDTITLSRADIVDIPNGDIVIVVDKENNCITAGKPLYDGLTIPQKITDDTHRIYVINYQKLNGNTCNKISIELVEFVQ